jgi:hypothetical protein
MISKKALDEFKSIWKKQFGEEISDQKALEQGTNLLNLFNAVYRPIKKEWVEENKNREEKI